MRELRTEMRAEAALSELRRDGSGWEAELGLKRKEEIGEIGAGAEGMGGRGEVRWRLSGAFESDAASESLIDRALSLPLGASEPLSFTVWEVLSLRLRPLALAFALALASAFAPAFAVDFVLDLLLAVEFPSLVAAMKGVAWR